MRDVVLVLGMHRSGTSALTRLLSLCGARLPADLVPPASDNPSGFWESRECIALDEAFLLESGSSPYDPGFMLETQRPAPQARETFEERIAGFLARLPAGGTVVVKDPRIALLLPYWISAARRGGCTVKAVHVFRNPYEVAASLHVRQRMSQALGMALWLQYNLMAERDARQLPHVFVSYGEMIADWRAVVSRCISGLRVELDAGDKAARRIDDFLAAELRHHIASGDETIGCPQLESRARATLALLERAVRGELSTAGFDAEIASVRSAAPALAEEASRAGLRRESALLGRFERLDLATRDALARLEQAEVRAALGGETLGAQRSLEVRPEIG